jgi:hypothetical protein
VAGFGPSQYHPNVPLTVSGVPQASFSPDYRFAQTIVTRRVVELGLAPQRAPFVSGTKG